MTTVRLQTSAAVLLLAAFGLLGCATPSATRTEAAMVTLTPHDIGSPTHAGSTIATAGGLEMIAGGADIWGKGDHAHTALRPVDGDFTVTVRVTSLGLSHPYAKAGLMVRESLDPASPMVYHFVFPDNRARNKNSGGVEFHVRETAGGRCVAAYPPAIAADQPAPFPVTFPDAWLRITRSGETFDCAVSADGKEWRTYHRQVLALPRTVFVGLASTAHDDSTTTRSTYTDLALTGAANGQP